MECATLSIPDPWNADISNDFHLLIIIGPKMPLREDNPGIIQLIVRSLELDLNEAEYLVTGFLKPSHRLPRGPGRPVIRLGIVEQFV